MVSTRRRTTRGKVEGYSIGDKVEVVRVGGIDLGILLSKEEDEEVGSGETTHWVVSVDGSQEEEVISERALGRVVEAHESDASSTIDRSAKEPPVRKGKKSKNKVGAGKKANHRVHTRAASKHGDVVKLNSGLETDRKTAPKPKRKDGDETVVEVKMLTGTLFIYRGKHHRVEFVRTV